jgi:hypothetical protein
MKKILVLYVFNNYTDDVKYFLNNGIYYQKNIDYIIICNNINIKFKIPFYATKIIRNNLNTDFDSWTYVLFKNKRYLDYYYFLFINEYAKGPFHYNNWIDYYINGLNYNIKLFGSSINIFCINIFTIKYLLFCKFFSSKEHNKKRLISYKIIEKGWNVYYSNIIYKKYKYKKTLLNTIYNVFFMY